MSRSVKLDTESLRASQARAQQSDRVVGRVERDLSFAAQQASYGAAWVDELDNA